MSLDHTHTYTGTQYIHTPWHSSPARYSSALLLSFAALHASYIQSCVRTGCSVSLTHADCNLKHFSCTPSTTIQMYTVECIRKGPSLDSRVLFGLARRQAGSISERRLMVHGGFIKNLELGDSHAGEAGFAQTHLLFPCLPLLLLLCIISFLLCDFLLKSPFSLCLYSSPAIHAHAQTRRASLCAGY